MTNEVLIIVPEIRKHADGKSSVILGPLDHQQLRLDLLFWDKLDSPTNNIFVTALQDDGELLAQQGFIVRSKVRMVGGATPSTIMEGVHAAAYRERERREPGRWSVSCSEGALVFPASDLEVDRGVLFRLFGAIPVPDKEVPIADILEFKDRRRAELLALRHHLERLFQGIATAPDRNLSELTELEALQLALKDHISVSRERKFPLRLTDLKAKFDWATITTAGVAFHESIKAGLPIVDSALSAAAGAAVASVRVSVGLRDHKPSSTPFQYVSSFHKELFRS